MVGSEKFLLIEPLELCISCSPTAQELKVVAFLKFGKNFDLIVDDFIDNKDSSLFTYTQTMEMIVLQPFFP